MSTPQPVPLTMRASLRAVRVIMNVFDQSAQRNHLGQRHKLINASRHSVTVGGKTPVYGMWCAAAAELLLPRHSAP